MLAGAGLLVNTTSLGMTGAPGLEIDLSQLPLDAVVVDIVYVPLDTPLLIAARRRGNRTVDGLGMLLHQGRPGFEAWFGTAVRVTRELRAAVLTTLVGPRQASGDRSRPYRLDRDGKEHRGRHAAAAWACRCSTPMLWCTGCWDRAARRWPPSRRCFPACATRPARSIGAVWAGACLAIRRRCGGSKRSCIRWCATPRRGSCAQARARRESLVVLDIPLLFETGAPERCDYVLVVSAPARVQRERVMRRPGMTESRFASILRAQMPDREKRRRADFVVSTGLGRG